MAKDPALSLSLLRAYDRRIRDLDENKQIPFPKLREKMNRADYVPGYLGELVHDRAKDAEKNGWFEKMGLRSVKGNPEAVRKIVKGENPAFVGDGSLRTIPIIIAQILFFIRDEEVEERQDEIKELFMTEAELEFKQQSELGQGQQLELECDQETGIDCE